MVYPNEYEAKALIIEFGRRCYERGLVSGNEGNLSCRVSENEVWCTPTMESKGYLTADMLIKVDLNANMLNSTSYKPTSEIKMHLGVYQENPEAIAVIHTHAQTATAFACCGKPVPTKMLPEAAIIFGAQIDIAPYGTPGTFEVPDGVRPFARKAKAVLLENHGALTWGPTMKDAYFTMETLENYCKIYKTAYLELGQAHDVPRGIEKMLELHQQITWNDVK